MHSLRVWLRLNSGDGRSEHECTKLRASLQGGFEDGEIAVYDGVHEIFKGGKAEVQRRGKMDDGIDI